MEQNVQSNASVRTRTVRSEEQILKLLDEYEASGFSVKDFCEVSDVNEATFYSWQKKYRSKPDSIENGFATIEVVSPTREPGPALFAEVGLIKIYREVSAEFLKSLL